MLRFDVTKLWCKMKVCYTDDVARIILSMKSSSLSSQPTLQKILRGLNEMLLALKGQMEREETGLRGSQVLIHRGHLEVLAHCHLC